MDTIETLSVIAIMLVIVIAIAAMVGFFVVIRKIRAPVPGKDLDPGRWINSVRDIIGLVESNTPDRSFIQSPVTDVFQACDRPRRVHPGHIKIEEREGTPQYTDYSAPSSYPIPDHSFIQSPLMTGGCLKCDRPSWVHPGQVKIEEPEGKS
jgi:hypothetical protein